MDSSQPEPATVPWPCLGSLQHHLLALALALAGGCFGIVGAAIQEVRSGAGILDADRYTR